MDVLIILLGFAILSAMFTWLSREVREINPYLSIIFLVGAMLFLGLVAATIYQAANVGEQVVANQTQINEWGLCPNNGNSTGTFSNTTYMEMQPCISNVTILYNYTYTTNFKAFAVDSPIIVIEWLVFFVIAIFMLMEIIKLVNGVRRARNEGINGGS